ncbi:YgaP family membrane protein [Paraglaciecola sp.]|uniref:YgaP family membrane protein n=1 Tax=Paraglaciecola sp. TaxID=1920173 RepID=UPI003EF23875
MKQNVGVLDTAIRSIIAVICLAIAFEEVLPLEGTIVLATVGSLLWFTVSTGVCFLYKLLGIDTYPGAGHGITQTYP